jgi:hypothetical protein
MSYGDVHRFAFEPTGVEIRTTVQNLGFSMENTDCILWGLLWHLHSRGTIP